MRFLDAAERELREAADWYEEQRSGLGERFLSEAEQATGLIESRPGIGNPWNRPDVPTGVRRLPLRTFPYHMVYVAEPELMVVAIAHVRRQPGYWSDRLQGLVRP